MDDLFLNIKRLLDLRDIKRGRSYLISNGFTDNEARLVLSGNVKEVKLTLLARLATLFNCTVDELLDWRGDAKSPLAVLRKPVLPEVGQLLANKSPKEIEELLKRIAKGEL